MGYDDMEPLLVPSEAKHHYGGIMSMTFILMQDLVSAAVVTMPFNFYGSGLTLGFLVSTLVCLLSSYTVYKVYLITSALNRSKKSSFANQVQETQDDDVDTFADMVGHCYGDAGHSWSSLFIFLANFGALNGQLMLITSLFLETLHMFSIHIPILSHRTGFLLIIVLCMGPIAYRQNIAEYEWVSVISLFSIVAFLLFLLVPFTKDIFHDSLAVPDPWIGSSVGSTLGGYLFLYTCQDVSVSVMRSLRNANPKRVKWVSLLSLLGSHFIMVSVGVTGYVMFGSAVSANLMSSFHANWVTLCMRIGLIINLAVAIPYLCFMPRVAIKGFLRLFVSKKTLNASSTHYISTTMILLSALIITISVRDLGAVYDATGGIAASWIAYTFPGLCMMKVPTSGKDRVIGLFLTLLGLGISIYVGISLILSIWG